MKKFDLRSLLDDVLTKDKAYDYLGDLMEMMVVFLDLHGFVDKDNEISDDLKRLMAEIPEVTDMFDGFEKWFVDEDKELMSDNDLVTYFDIQADRILKEYKGMVIGLDELKYTLFSANIGVFLASTNEPLAYISLADDGDSFSVSLLKMIAFKYAKEINTFVEDRMYAEFSPEIDSRIEDLATEPATVVS